MHRHLAGAPDGLIWRHPAWTAAVDMIHSQEINFTCRIYSLSLRFVRQRQSPTQSGASTWTLDLVVNGVEAVGFMENIDVCLRGLPHGEAGDTSRFLPPLHDGHAPIVMHLAFQDALESFEEWTAGTEEPTIQIDGRQMLISAVFCSMIDCTDLLPRRTLETLHANVRPADRASFEGGRATFSEAGRAMFALYTERRASALQPERLG